MIYNIESGDYVKYLGMLKVTDVTPKLLFEDLTIGNLYRVIEKVNSSVGDVYLCVRRDLENDIYYPIENFKFSNYGVGEKYNLR